MKSLGTLGSLIVGHHLKASHRWAVALVLFLLASPLFLAAQNITCTLSFTPATGTAPLSTIATGGCTDPVGNIISESLDWGDGTPPATISTFDNFSLPHTYASPANFTATLMAIDDVGESGFITAQVIVTPPAPTCTLRLSPPSVANGIPVTATGKCSDPGGVIVSTQLDWGDGTVVQGVTSGTHTYAAPGSFTVKVSATNSGGLTGSASQPIIVTVNAPPTCTLTVTPLTGIAPPPLQVTATGSCSDPEGDITSTSLDWGDGTIVPNVTSGTHTYANPGTFMVKVTATDVVNQVGSDSKVVVVSKNLPPICTLSVAPLTGVVPLTVTATGTCTDPDDAITSTVLDWGDRTTASAASGTHTYSTAGTFKVVLTATDTGGGKGTASQTVNVGVLSCTMQVTSASGKVPLVITATANCTGNNITSTVISFGDGFYQSGSTVSHTFVSAGTFTVSVTASDQGGNVSSPASSPVSVSDSPSLFVGVSNGQIEQFDRSGNLIKTLNTGLGGSVTGMAFDGLDALYATDFTADTVSKFDGSGNLVGTFGKGYNCQPESIVFDNAGNAYVGETGCSHALLKFDAYGNLLAGSAVGTEVEGSDWIDLASDQCTIFYTSQGTTVFRFNACTGQQLSTFATDLHTGLGLRILPDGGVLVADNQDIVRLDSGGRTITTYNTSGESCWVSVTLDPDGTSFWAVDYCSSDIVQFDINSGNQLAKFNSGTPTQTVYGIAMRGAARQTTAAGPLIATQQTLTVSAGQSASFDLAFTPASAAVNQTFSFSCANLPIGATCSFSPQTALATSSGVTISVSVSTTKTTASLAPSPFVHLIAALWLLLPGMVLLSDIRRKGKGRKLRLLSLVVLVVILASLLACGGGSSSTSSNPISNPTPSPPTPSSLATPPGTYPIVVQATSNSLVSSTVVSLSVH